MFHFIYLDKNKKTEYLPLLFDILYSNMKDIAPIEFIKEEFIQEVGTALEKEPRKIVILYHGDELAGFLMYYTRENMIMIEELQIVKKYQRTKLLYQLCKFMISILPENIAIIESFVDKRNSNSLSLQSWLEMKAVESVNDNLLKMRGSTQVFMSKIRKK